MSAYGREVAFETLKGRTITAIEGLEKGSARVVFTCADGAQFEMEHDQSCCECVDLEDIVGDVADLIGAEVVDASERSCSKGDADAEPSPETDYESDSWTWTFYVIQTTRGAVTLRWFGSSNGYYGEDVSFRPVNP